MRPAGPKARSPISAEAGSQPASAHVRRLSSSVKRLRKAERAIMHSAGMMPALAIAKPIVSMPLPRQLLSKFTIASWLLCSPCSVSSISRSSFSSGAMMLTMLLTRSIRAAERG